MALFTKSQLQHEAQLRKSRGFTKTASAKLLDEARSFDPDKQYDIFLAHASLDAEEIWELRSDLELLGYSVYVDWIDAPQLDRSHVTRQTAALLKKRMRACSSLFFATTPNSRTSIWMPWELGYFDGKGGQVAIVPVLQAQPEVEDAYLGREYLALYPYVSLNPVKGTLKKDLFINNDPDTYVVMREWLSGEKPWRRPKPLVVPPRLKLGACRRISQRCGSA